MSSVSSRDSLHCQWTLGTKSWLQLTGVQTVSRPTLLAIHILHSYFSESFKLLFRIPTFGRVYTQYTKCIEITFEMISFCNFLCDSETLQKSKFNDSFSTLNRDFQEW